MAKYKQRFEYGETVYLLNITNTHAPVIRELKITNLCQSITIPSLVEYTAYEIGKELDNQWWFYGDEKNIFHTRVEAEQCLEYLREVFKDNPLEKMPREIAIAHVDSAVDNFVTRLSQPCYCGDKGEIIITDQRHKNFLVLCETCATKLYKELGDALEELKKSKE